MGDADLADGYAGNPALGVTLSSLGAVDASWRLLFINLRSPMWEKMSKSVYLFNNSKNQGAFLWHEQHSGKEGKGGRKGREEGVVASGSLGEAVVTQHFMWSICSGEKGSKSSNVEEGKSHVSLFRRLVRKTKDCESQGAAASSSFPEYRLSTASPALSRYGEASVFH